MTVLSRAELDAVARVMAEAGVHAAAPLIGTVLASGRSNVTIRLADDVREWVLRMPPRVGRTPSAHDVAREFRVTSALRTTDVPVPPAVVLCEDESVLGGPFAVAEFVPGASVQTRSELDRLDSRTVDAIVDALVATLAALHRVDHLAVGLERFGRPDQYAERQFRRWSGQWDLVGAEQHASLAAEVMSALGSRLPRQDSTGIVHGDFRIDNTLLTLGLGDGEIAAVVDWELSTIGDPVADVAMMCAYRDTAFDLIVGEPSAWTSARLPTSDGLMAAYEAADGVRLVDWEQHLALAHFKIAVIAAGIAHRARLGASAGPGFDTAGEAVLPFLMRAREALSLRQHVPTA